MNGCSCAQCLGRTIERATKEKRGHSAPCVRRYATSCSCSGCRAVEVRLNDYAREQELTDAHNHVIQAAKALARNEGDQYDLLSDVVEAVETLERLERESS